MHNPGLWPFGLADPNHSGHFAPLFADRTWPKAQLLAVGALLVNGRRTVASALRIMGLGDEPPLLHLPSPAQSRRLIKREYDKHTYKERNLAERFINRIKQYRRVATRYEKTGRNFLGFVHVAAIMVLLL